MSPEEHQAMQTLAAEAERLKNDPSFATAVLANHAANTAELIYLNRQ